MTPKEKCDGLVGKFIHHADWFVFEYDQVNGEPTITQFQTRNAIHCAIIAVNEVIEVIDDFEFSNHGKIGNNYGQKFWYEVKEELEKM